MQDISLNLHLVLFLLGFLNRLGINVNREKSKPDCGILGRDFSLLKTYFVYKPYQLILRQVWDKLLMVQDYQL
jgi:hypothetical protein